MIGESLCVIHDSKNTLHAEDAEESRRKWSVRDFLTKPCPSLWFGYLCLLYSANLSETSALLRVQNVLQFLVLLTHFSSQGREGAGGLGGIRFVKMM